MSVKTILTCEQCGTEQEFQGPYHIAKEEFREEGWRNINTGTKEQPEWTILCPKCKDKQK